MSVPNKLSKLNLSTNSSSLGERQWNEIDARRTLRITSNGTSYDLNAFQKELPSIHELL